MSKKCFIYMIKNKVNNKVYIGQTRQGKHRWEQHRRELNKNIHYNTHLQRSWNKYGKDNFEFTIVEYCKQDDLNDKERYWISYYDSMNNGYNRDSGGGVGKELSKETIDRLIEVNLKNSKEVYQYDLDGNLVKKYISIGSVKRDGFNASNVGQCCNGKNLTYNDYVWSFKPLSKEEVISKRTSRQKPIHQYDLDGNLVNILINIKECSDDYVKSAITACCMGRVKTHKGYIWSYDELDEEELNKRINDINNFIPVYQYDFDSNLVKYYNHIGDVKQHGFSQSNVGQCCRGKQLTHKGYIWSYDELSKEEILEKIEKSKVANTVYQYNIDGDLVKVWDNLNKCVDKGFNESHIYGCCIGRQTSHNGFIWSYEPLSKEYIQGLNIYIADNKPKEVYQYDLDGNLIKKYPNIRSTINDGFDNKNVSRVCNGIKITYKDFIWSFKPLSKKDIEKIIKRKPSRQKPVYQHDLDGNLINIYKNLKEVEEHGFCKCSVVTCCNKDYGYDKYKDFIWSYRELKKEEIKIKKIYQYDKDYNLVRTYNRIKDLEEYGFNSNHISECYDGKLHHGYYWSKEEIKEEDKTELKKIYQYDTNKELIKIYNSFSDINNNEFEEDGIIACCIGRIKKYNNYIWSYNELSDIELQDKINYCENKATKQIYQYDKNYNLIKTYSNLKSVNDYGFNSSGVCNCCNGRSKSYKGYIWSYKPLKVV